MYAISNTCTQIKGRRLVAAVYNAFVTLVVPCSHTKMSSFSALFVQSPVSLTTYDDGTEVEFACHVVDADGVVWTLNGTTTWELNDASFSVSQQTETTTTGNKILSILTIVASSSHDNSLMRCKTVGHSEVSSDAALLRVQGTTLF